MDAIPAALIPTAVLLVESPGGNLLDANRAATQGLGYSLRQMQRLCLADLLAGSGRDGDQVLQDIAASDAPTAFSADVAAKGERRRYRFLAQPSVGANRSVVLLVGMDVTDELAHTRSLETDARRLRALIESNFDAYYDWHMAEGFHEWSPQMDELVGLETGTFPNSLQAWIERLHPSEQEAVVARTGWLATAGSYSSMKKEDQAISWV
jgi:PAS domain-containing protein